MALDLSKINSLAELERCGWAYEPRGDNEVAIRCPAHDDTKPSALLNVEKGLWKCHAATCGVAGDIVTLLAYLGQSERAVVLEDLGRRYELVEQKSLPVTTVEKYHQAVWDAGPLLQALYKRGVTDEMIRDARIGYWDGRLTIPVYDAQRRVVNIRRYLPGAPGPEKMKNTRGYGKPQLYQIEQLRHDRVWVCGGELKALVPGSILAERKIGAVSLTAGEGNWEPKFTHLFKGKRVWLCYDIDLGGRAGAVKVAKHLATQAAEVRIIRLPLDPEKHPKGDINDYVVEVGATADELEALMEAAEVFTLDGAEGEPDLGAPVEVKLADSTQPDYVGRRLQLGAVVQAMDTTPYLVPRTVGVSCTKDQPNCAWCPVRPLDPDEQTGKVTLTVSSTSPGILDLVETPKATQDVAIRSALRIPQCKVATFTIRDHHDVLDTRLTPQLEMGGDNADHVVQSAMVVGAKLDLNTPYTFGGRVLPHPKTQQAVLLLDEVGKGRDSLSDYEPAEDELEALRVFQPDAWTTEGLDRRLDAVYDDLEANVTRIYHRRDLHLLIDLAYHSLLSIQFDAETQRGWMNVIVTGDSSQGKSETADRLREHYRLGERVDCKTATAAGLLGGLQQLGNRWFVSWGVIPTHDRRLVVLEEVKGTSTETIAALTDMRSSGVAQISKIEKRRAHARTRLVFISNPRSDRPVSAYNFGVETIKELIGGLEDIRRFDVALVVAKEQIDVSEINRLTADRPVRQHEYTADLCQRLILWAWTRDAAEVVFDREAELRCMEEAVRLCERFTDDLPLIDRGSMRHKLARMSAALAARTFSTGETAQSIRVRVCHVQYIAEWLTRIYSDPVMGYEDFSRAQIFTRRLIDADIVQRQIKGTKYPRDLVENILYRDEITLNDICDWCELDRDEAQRLLAFLVRKHAVYRVQRHYVKNSQFINLLKNLRAGGLANRAEDSPQEEF